MADPKIGWIYVISCEMYKKENIVKIGYTEKPDLIEEEVKISLLQRYGTTLIDPYIISLTKVSNPKQAEKYVFTKLIDIKIKKEIFKAEYDNINNVINITNHPSITWEEYKNKKSHWISNHPSLCYRKKAVLEAGNYDVDKSRMTEDFDLTLRMLKTHGYLHNLSESLLYYRLHDKQVTHQGGLEGPLHWHKNRVNLIDELIHS